jgi:hypothetical protein
VTFEAESSVRQISRRAFAECGALVSICVPASVEVMCEECFFACAALSTVEFEAGSRLSRVEKEAFGSCPSLLPVAFPPSLNMYEELSLEAAD